MPLLRSVHAVRCSFLLAFPAFLLTSVSSAALGQDAVSVSPEKKTKASSHTSAPSAPSQTAASPVSPIALSPLRVQGRSTDLVGSMKIDPDADYSNVGKARVLTQTTTMKTFQDRMIDNISDYSRRVDAAVNFNTNNSSINMRGLDQNRILTTIDGIRSVWTNNGARGLEGGISGYDFNSLSAIDVVKNASSSFFGTGALGGVVAMRTLEPEDILKPGKTVGGLTKLTYDGSSESAYLNQAFAARYHNTVVLVQGGFQDGSQTGNRGTVGGVGTSRTKRDPASYTQGNFLGKIQHYFAGGHRIGLTGEVFDRNYNENTLSNINSTYSTYHTLEETKRSRVSGGYDYKSVNPLAFISEAHLIAYWQKVDTITNTASNRLIAPIGIYDRNDKLTTSSYGVTGSVSSNVFTGPFHHAITLGGEAYLTDTSEYAAGRDNCTASIYACAYLHNNQSDMPNVHGTDLGAIVQDRIGYGKHEWLHITPGFRFDWYKRNPQQTASYTANAIYDGFPAASSTSHFSPKVLAEVRVADKVTLYAQYNTAFRAPSANELYLTYGGTGSYAAIGNPALKPETSRGWEAGVRYGDSKRGANISVYDNYYHNFIDQVTTTADEAGIDGSFPFGVFKYVNRQRVRIYGVEARANWTFGEHWLAWTSLAYSDGKDQQEHVHLNSVAPFRGIVGVGYVSDRWGANFSTTFAAARNKVQDPSSSLNKTPGYAIFDLNGWYSPAFFPNMKIQAGMYNMFNKRYYSALDIPDSSTVKKAYYSQPGRSFKVTALINF
ncbi:TonB-dependent hemoglobin/transferrin/lactoferrin family receptor [Acetobacter sicerae]|nr:TonB-dependent hemoglobin/transferrin/lactoferrin family receptor [Acetobacter sicerae]